MVTVPLYMYVPVCGCGEFIENIWIRSWIVVFGMAKRFRENVELFHSFPSEHDWQPFVVGYVLQLGGHNATSLLEENLIVPTASIGIQLFELVSYAIVLFQ